MPYIDLVNSLNDKCVYKMNHKQLFKDVRAAMRKGGSDADLKEAFLKNYERDGKAYTRFRGEHDLDELRSPLTEKENVSEKFLNYGQYLLAYANIVEKMASEINPSYRAGSFMFGLTEKEVVKTVNDQIYGFTQKDSIKYDVKKYFEKQDLIDQINGYTFKLDNDPKSKERFDFNAPFNYAEGNEDRKSKLRKVYNIKESVKEELQSKGFFWKLFNYRKVRDMRAVIAAAESSLQKTGFPESAISDAIFDGEGPTLNINSEELEVSRAVIGHRFLPQSVKDKEKFFNPSYVPNIDLSSSDMDYKADLQLANQAYEDYVKDNPDLSSEARDVFMEKFDMLKEADQLFTSIREKKVSTNDQVVQVNQKYQDFIARAQKCADAHSSYLTPSMKTLDNMKKWSPFFDADFKPQRDNLNELREVAVDLTKRLHDDRKFLKGDAKELLSLNIKKVNFMSNHFYEYKDELFNSTFEKISNDFKGKYPDYKKPSLKGMPKPKYPARKKPNQVKTNNVKNEAKVEAGKEIKEEPVVKETSVQKDNIIMESRVEVVADKKEDFREAMNIPELDKEKEPPKNIAPKIEGTNHSKEQISMQQN